MSQQRLSRRGSGLSYSSDESVETTRGPILGDGSGSGNDGSQTRSKSRRRRNSDSSVSTVETFATADEGRSSKPGSIRHSFDSYRASERLQSESSDATKRSSYGPGTLKMNANGPFSVSSSRTRDTNRHSDGSISPIPEEGKESENSTHRQRPSVARRPHVQLRCDHRNAPPTIRIVFRVHGYHSKLPLVNKHAKSNSTGVLTPNSSPDQELKSISDTLLNETANSYGQQRAQQEGDARGHFKGDSVSSVGSTRFIANPNSPQALQALLREDQYLVERLVASLGRCVLGLTESGRASAESRMYRRRIDAARRILEGIDLDSSDSL